MKVEAKYELGDVLFHIEWDGDRFEEPKPYAAGPYTISSIKIGVSINTWGKDKSVSYSGVCVWKDGNGNEHENYERDMGEEDLFKTKGGATRVAKQRWNKRCEARKM